MPEQDNKTKEAAKVIARRFHAVKTCTEWLAFCLKIGWPKDSLDRLEELWWEYHDENGKLLKPST